MANRTRFRVTKWHGRAIAEAAQSASKRGIDATMAEAVRVAKPLTPVRTGTLQGSIQMRPARTVGRRVFGQWGSFTVRYALYVELGTRYFSGRRMLTKAAEKTYDKLPGNIQKAFSSLTSRFL